MQARLTFAHCLASCGPDFGFYTTAADCSYSLAIFEKQHLGAAALRRRATGMRNSGDNNTLAARVRLINKTIKLVLCDSTHTSAGRSHKQKMQVARELEMASAMGSDFLQLL